MPLKIRADEIVAKNSITLNGVLKASWPVSFTFIRGEIPGGVVDGANAAFTLANAPAAGSVVLFLNGLRLLSGAGNDYTLTGANITMATAPQAGDVLIADYHF